MSILAATLFMLMGGVGPATQTPTTVPPQPVAEKKAGPAQAEFDPLVCQVHQELGSLIKRRKVCLHKSEWDRQILEERQMINRTQVLRGITPAG